MSAEQYLCGRTGTDNSINTRIMLWSVEDTERERKTCTSLWSQILEVYPMKSKLRKQRDGYLSINFKVDVVAHNWGVAYAPLKS